MFAMKESIKAAVRETEYEVELTCAMIQLVNTAGNPSPRSMS